MASSSDMDLKNERVLLSGGSGFLGKFVCEELKRHDCIPIVPRKKDFNLVSGEDIRRLISITKPTVIIHLAAVCGGIGANQKEPGKFFYDNAMMGIQLIEEARKAGTKKFICIGTVCAYPADTKVPFKESDLWSGYPEETNAPYGIAKKVLLVQLQSYRKQYGFNGVFLLPVNLYGPGDNFDLNTSHVIPAMIRKMIEAKEASMESVTLWGTGAPSREFLFVEDCASMIVKATQTIENSDPINLGTGKSIRMSELAELIKMIVGFEGSIQWDVSKPDGQTRRQLSTLKAQLSRIHNAPTELHDGIKRTVDWYLDHLQSTIRQSRSHLSECEVL